MNKVIQLIVTLIISLNFCSCENKPFGKYNFSKGEYKLYFCYQANDYNLVPGTRITPDIKKEFGDFYITDKNVLEFIQKNAIKEKVKISNPLNSFYSLRLTCNGKGVDGAILDIDNSEILTGKGKYKFNLSGLVKLSDGFKKMNSYTINCSTISGINKLSRLVKSKHGFTFYGIQGEKNPFEDFSGKIELITLVNQGDFSSNFKKNLKRFESELNEIGKGQIFDIFYEGGDTLKISMLWDKDYTSELPKRYKVVKAFSDSIDFIITVYDIEKGDLIELLDSEKEMKCTIEDMN